MEPIEQHIIDKIKHAAELYNRLILVVAPAGVGKTSAFQGVKESIGVPVVNVNLELSRRLLDLTERQRSLQVPQLLDEIVAQAGGDVILLDNVEILFDTTLKQDPLRLLQGLSRNRTVVAAWSGSVSKGNIIYAVPDHPEYRKYQVRDFLIVSPMTATQEQTK